MRDEWRPSDFGCQFRNGWGTYRIGGVLQNRPKFPIEGGCVHTKKRMLFTAYGVKAGLLPPVCAPVAACARSGK